MDTDFWRRYLGDVFDTFKGELISSVFVHQDVKPIPLAHPENSGAGAIALAHLFGPRRILLVGYDASWHGDKRHCHDDYPKGMGNAGSVDKWPGHFETLSRSISGVEIINCSQRTELKCFPRSTLETELARCRSTHESADA